MCGKMRKAYKILVGYVRRRGHIEDLGQRENSAKRNTEE
jgi:hypothetical protein